MGQMTVIRKKKKLGVKLVVPFLDLLYSAASGYVSFLAVVFVVYSLSVPLSIPTFKQIESVFSII
jgi:hypothetical protein